jgi:hypothetical protein
VSTQRASARVKLLEENYVPAGFEGVAGVQELQELQNKKRNRTSGPCFLKRVSSEESEVTI